MRQAIPTVIVAALTFSSAHAANPIPVPRPANMPYEDMTVIIGRTASGLHAAFDGNYTFTYIPADVTAMLFPVPSDAQGIGVDSPWVWRWSTDLYPTVLPEEPNLPMIAWDGPWEPFRGLADWRLQLAVLLVVTAGAYWWLR